jgi:SAM-dependent methyltransferase
MLRPLERARAVVERRRASEPSPPPRSVIPERVLVPRSLDRSLAATSILYDRLTDGDVAEVLQRMSPEDRWAWDAASEIERHRLTLSFGLLHQVEGVSQQTGLSSATPPPEVHSMVHGWTTEIGGSYYLADLVLGGLQEIDAVPKAGTCVLDFSCSSGRVVRPLQAALPAVHWHGCDPNAGAIAWMQENVPDVQTLVSPTSPPLPWGDGSFDVVYAISVWSHFSPASAVVWLAELRRLVRPGGHVLLTAHGLQACHWFTNNADVAIEARLEARLDRRDSSPAAGRRTCVLGRVRREGRLGSRRPRLGSGLLHA